MIVITIKIKMPFEKSKTKVERKQIEKNKTETIVTLLKTFCDAKSILIEKVQKNWIY